MKAQSVYGGAHSAAVGFAVAAAGSVGDGTYSYCYISHGMGSQYMYCTSAVQSNGILEAPVGLHCRLLRGQLGADLHAGSGTRKFLRESGLEPVAPTVSSPVRRQRQGRAVHAGF